MMAAAAMLAASGGNGAQARAGAAECKTITVQPDAAYGISEVRKLRICR